MLQASQDPAQVVGPSWIEGTGNYSRKVSTNSAVAQRYFDQGLNLLFAFNHDEARSSFLAAAKADPELAMAYWGAAISYGPHINFPMVPPDQEKEAHALIQKAKRASGSTTLEREIIQVAGLRYSATPGTDRRERDIRYANAMGRLSARHRGDADIATFYAEALMDLRPWDLWKPNGSPQPGTSTILSTLERAMQLRPDHPLANHLYIHAVEASPNPYRGFDAANRLRNLQPGLGHNVHMPSHIDVRTGSWHAAIESNRMAIAADTRYEARRPKQGFYRVYMTHNRHMLAFAAMMSGQGNLAIETMDDMVAQFPKDWLMEMAPAVDGWIAMPLEARVRFGRWDEILAAPEPDAVFPLSRAMRHVARGIAYSVKGDLASARAEQRAFRTARTRVPKEATFGNNASHDILNVADRMLAGEIEIQAGNLDRGINLLKEAAAFEDQLRYDEPPDWILPIRHPLGAALLRAGRLDEAERIYREDLRKWPNNGWALHGLREVARRKGRTELEQEMDRRFKRVWAKADTEIRSSCLCIDPR